MFFPPWILTIISFFILFCASPDCPGFTPTAKQHKRSHFYHRSSEIQLTQVCYNRSGEFFAVPKGNCRPHLEWNSTCWYQNINATYFLLKVALFNIWLRASVDCERWSCEREWSDLNKEIIRTVRDKNRKNLHAGLYIKLLHKGAEFPEPEILRRIWFCAWFSHGGGGGPQAFFPPTFFLVLPWLRRFCR